MKKFRVEFMIDNHSQRMYVFANSGAEAERIVKLQFPRAGCITAYEER
jgi:hypothetical protein